MLDLILDILNTFDYVLLSDLKNKVIAVVLQSTLRAFYFHGKKERIISGKC